jgi:hypothetical protein
VSTSDLALYLQEHGLGRYWKSLFREGCELVDDIDVADLDSDIVDVVVDEKGAPIKLLHKKRLLRLAEKARNHDQGAH